MCPCPARATSPAGPKRTSWIISTPSSATSSSGPWRHEPLAPPQAGLGAPAAARLAAPGAVGQVERALPPGAALRAGDDVGDDALRAAAVGRAREPESRPAGVRVR